MEMEEAVEPVAEGGGGCRVIAGAEKSRRQERQLNVPVTKVDVSCLFVLHSRDQINTRTQ